MSAPYLIQAFDIQRWVNRTWEVGRNFTFRWTSYWWHHLYLSFCPPVWKFEIWTFRIHFYSHLFAAVAVYNYCFRKVAPWRWQLECLSKRFKILKIWSGLSQKPKLYISHKLSHCVAVGNPATCSRGAVFASRPGDRLSLMRLFMGFLSTSGQIGYLK
jgi:hypothetical protein